jgi:hypothetical protein
VIQFKAFILALWDMIRDYRRYRQFRREKPTYPPHWYPWPPLQLRYIRRLTVLEKKAFWADYEKRVRKMVKKS